MTELVFISVYSVTLSRFARTKYDGNDRKPEDTERRVQQQHLQDKPQDRYLRHDPVTELLPIPTIRANHHIALIHFQPTAITMLPHISQY